MNIEPRVPAATADVSRGRISLPAGVREVLVFGAILLAVYLAVGWAGERLAARCPDAWEARLASWDWADQKEGGVGEAPPAWDRALDLFARVRQASGLQRDLPYQVQLAAPGMGPNAFAAPGGVVVVTPELLDRITTEEGLAFILAHELGHHEGRHVLRRVGRRLLLSALVGLVSENAATSALDASVSFGELAFDRDQERAADLFALRVTRDMFGDPRNALEFFEHLVAESPERLPAMFSTHPSTAERLASLRRLMDETSRKQP